MTNGTVVTRLGRAIRLSDEISSGYTAGCMNVAVTVYELCREEFCLEPVPVAVVGPKATQRMADHYVIAFDHADTESVHDEPSLPPREGVQYVDQNGSHNTITRILDNLGYTGEKKKTVKIRSPSVELIKQNIYYDDKIRNIYKQSIQYHL